MRKQNSTFKTAFLSEAGSELRNNDYFAFAELDDFACYVIADGITDLPDAEGAKLAIESVILKFQEHPSMKKPTVFSYINAANKALLGSTGKNRLKASITIVVSDYARIRYAYAGNTRLRIYREGNVKESTKDMSLSQDMAEKEKIPEDVLTRHEERNNLHTYIGQEKDFHPFISKKIKLMSGDILALYTKGIWENLDEGEVDDIFSEVGNDTETVLNSMEDMLLSKQPENLGNYTFAVIFADKVFLAPNKRQNIKKIVTVVAVVLIICVVICVAVWYLRKTRAERIEDMNLKYTNTIEYVGDNNYIRAREECEAALEVAEKLKDKEMKTRLSDYLKLIEAVITADDAYGGGDYEEAQTAYLNAKERMRYADNLGDTYIEARLSKIEDYLLVFDYIQLGDSLAENERYALAEEKYLAAKKLATSVRFEDGRQDTLDALDKLYAKWSKAEEADSAEANAQAATEVSATQLVAQGNTSFEEKDYNTAIVYYTRALEKYQEIGNESLAETVMVKIEAVNLKKEERQVNILIAQEYEAEGSILNDQKEYLNAKKQYMLAKNMYVGLEMTVKVTEIEGILELLDTQIAMEKAAAEEALAQVQASEAEESVRASEQAVMQETAEETISEEVTP